MLINFETLLSNIITKKYQELQLGLRKKDAPFWKMREFENKEEIDLIGKTFIKQVFTELKVPYSVIRTYEYDLVANNLKIKIFTAFRDAKRQGVFPFQRINIRLGYDLLIFVAITETAVYYRIIKKTAIKQEVNKKGKRRYHIDIDHKPKRLIKMKANTEVFFKLNLTIKDLKKLKELETDLKGQLHN